MIPNSWSGFDFGLGEDADMLRKSVGDFAQDRIAPRADEIDHTNTFPRDLWTQMGELGLHGITVEEEYGGSGLGKEAMCVAQPSLSGGFHPHSMICPACPSATACATKLNAKHGFDVVALRLGKVDGLPEHVRKVVV